MARRQRIDSATGAVSTIAAADRDLSPPKHLRLRRGDRPFWDAIIAERANGEWATADLGPLWATSKNRSEAGLGSL